MEKALIDTLSHKQAFKSRDLKKALHVPECTVLFKVYPEFRTNPCGPPYRYLRFLFEKLPTTPAEDIHHLLPTKLKIEDLALPELPSGV